MASKDTSSRWLFCAVDRNDGEQTIPAYQVVMERVRRGAWPLGANTKMRDALRPGDTAILYVGGHRENRLTLVAEVALLSSIERPTSLSRVSLISSADLDAGFSSVVRIGHEVLYSVPVPIKEFTGTLSFLQATGPKWGNTMRNAIKRLSEADHEVIKAPRRRWHAADSG